MAEKYQLMIETIAARHRIPNAVAQAMIDTENPERDPTIIKNEAWGGGSYGLSMITIRTARGLGFAGEPMNLLIPDVNLHWGLMYLRRMFDKVGRGSWSRAVAAYNAGPDLQPWPAAHVERFQGHLVKWRKIYPGGVTARPILTAGIGGVMALMLAGLILPAMFKKK